MARILVVDDEVSMRRILSLILREEKHEIVEAEGVRRALELLSAGSFDLVITDKKMPDGDGIEIVRHCRENEPSLPVVMLTAFATVELAVETMQAGAFDFISKPFVPEVVTAVARRAIERTSLMRENEMLKEEAKRFAFADDIQGSSPAINDLRKIIGKVAPTDAAVLITGETGTGKELVARAIHRGSLRKNDTFLAVNCAAVPEQLLESELFGHEKGSFTGAEKTKQGLFEAAHRGTLFLDEAGDMSLNLQSKLLRALTDGEILRVGATISRKVDVRIITATNRDLSGQVREKLFREDLFYRLAVVPVHVPPLRERSEDIPTLVDYFLEKTARDLKVPVRRVTPGGLKKLMNYDFPGNVRELRNLIERACILATGVHISEADLFLQPSETHSATLDAMASEVSDLPELMRKIESDLIAKALVRSDGVQAEAARQLGISRSDIAYKIKKYGL